MDKSSSLGMSPGHPRKYPRSTSVKAWGCPRHPLFINKKSTRSFFNMLYFYCFIYYVLFLERLYFCCVFSFVFNKVGPHHILFWSETRSAVLHHILLWSETRFAVLHFVWERDTLHRTALSSCFSFISVQSLLVFLVWIAL